MTTTSMPAPEPSPEDVARVLAEIEQLLACQSPALSAARLSDLEPTDTGAEVAPDPATAVDEDEDEDEDEEILDGEPMLVEPGVSGETKRVQQLRQQVAEAHLLTQLQADHAPLMVDSDKVRKRRRAAHEAARLHELAQDPLTLAYRDQRVRRVVTSMVMAAAGIALAVSSIGVQASVAKALSLAQHTIGWWAAFGVEPALSLPLLAAVAVQAYSAMRGQVVDRKSPTGKKLFRTELLLLGLTLVLNCWPALTLGDGFSLLNLIVHSLGPVAAVTAVWVLPALWSVLAVLPVPKAAAAPTGRATASKYRANAAGPVGAQERAVDAHRARLHALIADGTLPAKPSASAIRDKLNCAAGTASLLRDEQAGGSA